MIPRLYLIFFLIGLALTFDMFNGFHDATNSVATVIITRVLSLLQAAAFFSFFAAFVFGTGVAKTTSEKLIDPHAVDVYVIWGGLISAIIWDIIIWLLALPTSSSHAIISGFAGAAIAKAGFGSILLKGWAPVIGFSIASPLIGLVLGYFTMITVSWITYRVEQHRAEKAFARLRLLSADAYSF